MSTLKAALQGVLLARQAIAQGFTSEDPSPEAWAGFYALMAEPQGPRSPLRGVSDNDWTLACCDAFRGAYKGLVQAMAPRTLTDDARGDTLKAIFELGANTGLCERLSTFTDSELTDLVLWVTTYGVRMAHEARTCTRCGKDCLIRLCDMSKPAPLPFRLSVGSEPATVEPITTSGWYKRTDGSRGRYVWHEGSPKCVEVEPASDPLPFSRPPIRQE